MDERKVPSLGALSLSLGTLGFGRLFLQHWPAWLSLGLLALGPVGLAVAAVREVATGLGHPGPE